MKIIAKPKSITFKDDGYFLLVEIVEGPQVIKGKFVQVKLSGAQLDQLGEWNPTQTSEKLNFE